MHCIVGVLLFFGVAVIGSAAAAEDDKIVVEEAVEPAIMFAGRIAGDSVSTRLFFDLDRKLDFTTFLMRDPNRIVIDGPSILFRFARPEDMEPRGLVSDLRYGAIARNKSRIVVTLSAPAEISAVSVRELGNEGNYRLVIDLAATNAADFERMVSRQQELVGTSGETVTKGDRVVRPDKDPDKFTIVIDPGHGGIDGGARGANGTREKDLTLQIATILATTLRRYDMFDVKLTREEDVFMSLRERVNFARRNHADLFVSLHADSLRQKWVRGASIYTLSKRASDDLALQLAESENMADIVAGLDSPEEEDAVTDILADLTARETAVFSKAFSSTLIRLLSNDIELIKNPQRSASFVVLKAPEIPGALLELGYLSNPDDESLLTDPKWQQNIASLIARSVKEFFEPRMQ